MAQLTKKMKMEFFRIGHGGQATPFSRVSAPRPEEKREAGTKAAGGAHFIVRTRDFAY